jgi:cytochrome c
LKHAGTAIAVLIVVIVGLSFLHPFGDPRIEPGNGLGTLLQGADISSDAKNVLISKCADCHSNETRWPVYARIAPGSWLIERDIAEARARMNLSHWSEMPPDEHAILIRQIIRVTKRGEMPPLQYRTLHWRARLTPADLAVLSFMGRRGLDESEASSMAGDAARGKLVFERRCTGCHAMDGDREGPRLAGVYGRRAGSVPGFEYSAGLKNSGVTWNEATLEKWLTDPDQIAPDTKMDFHVPKSQERADLIAYFQALSR